MSEHSGSAARITMQERIAEFDCDGTILDRAPQVFALLPDQGRAVAEAFVTAYLQRTGLENHMTASAKASMMSQSLRYVREKYTNLAGEEWGDIARASVREARKHDISVRTLLVALQASIDVGNNIIVQADLEIGHQRNLLMTVRRISIIEADTMCSVVAEDIAAEEKSERVAHSALFQQHIGDEVDAASRLGEGLREQAKDASGATRGMLVKVSEVAAAAEQSALAMREAAHISSGLIRAIDETRSEVESAAAIAHRASLQASDAVSMSTTLSDNAQAIESILGLIREIAGQTNLLALNATIEAARAGDAGRGFAVVAQEVKSLASQTSRATDDITNKIAAIQTSTRQSVDTNQRIQETVTEVQASADRIRSSMDAQAQTVTMITAAVDETALAADSMSRTVGTIRTDTEVVASEIDQLETGFSAVENKLRVLRTATEDFSKRVA
ncbi:MAG: methyl-accepting chemotaxis protein [Sphingobium sp.]